MARQRIHQSSFLRGELDPTIISRVDLSAYAQGLKKARNVIPINQGGIERRGGSVARADLGGTSRLETFIFNQNQEYIFAFQNQSLKIYSTNGTLVATLSSCPWITADLFEMDMTQSGDTMIITHQDFVPQVIQRIGATSFTRTAFGFETSVNGEQTYQPYFKFADDDITLDINNTSKGNTVTLTTNTAYWTSAYVGMIVRYHGTEILITGYTSSTVITGTLLADVSIELDDDPFKTTQGSGTVEVTMVAHGFTTGASITISGAEDIFDTDGNGLATGNLNGTFTITVTDDNHFTYVAGSSDTATESVDGGGVRVLITGHPPTRNWDEQVFSSVNGFPNTVTFHEQRLFFGGVTALPDGIQASMVADFFNFDVGDGEDSDSVQIQIASDQVNEIRHLISGKVLQILTSTGEFYLKPQVSKPITPTDIRIVSQSNLGSQLKAKPRIFDNATIFIQNNGKTVREFLYSTAAEEFSSNSISLLSNHLISTPSDTAKLTSIADRTEQFYFVVNSDGTIGIFTSQRSEKIAGWMQWNTDGEYESVACTTNGIYTAVKRTINGSPYYSLEQQASTAFDVPTDYTVTATVSGSYQPHGVPKVNGAISSTTTMIADGFTNAPSQGETFQFGGTGTIYTIQSATATGNSGEYTIVINASVSQSDNTTLQFVTSKVFSGLSTHIGKTVFATAGSTEGGAIYYYGSGVVDGSGNVTIDTPTTACDIGLDYSIDLETLPIDATIQGGQLTGLPRKIGKSVIELSSTYNVQINSNDVVLTETTLNTSSGLTSFTGKKEVYTLGYSLEPNLTITQSAPLPVRILGITSEIYY
tara:strand:- start:172 stop:2625 length:2454 start_codon:yes stop_codon:yes gene_type:complete